jgi:hypothetical protein
MAGVITTGNHPKALWPGIKAIWGRQYNEHAKEYTDLFDMDTSDQAYEEDFEVTGFGLAPVKPEGSGVQFDSETQGTVSRFTHIAYALGYIVTKEELDDNLYEQVAGRRTQALAFSMNQTQENVGANVYNKAFTGGAAGGDAADLIDASHPSRSGLQSNLLTTAAEISEASIEDMIIQIMGATNSRGMKINLMPQSLHVPRQQWFEANRILKSVLQNDTANNATNVLKATNALPKGIKVNHYFTSSTAWFIRTNAPRGMICYERKKAEFTKDNDFNTENAKAKAYQRSSYYWSDWRGLYGTPGV